MIAADDFSSKLARIEYLLNPDEKTKLVYEEAMTAKLDMAWKGVNEMGTYDAEDNPKPTLFRKEDPITEVFGDGQNRGM